MAENEMKVHTLLIVPLLVPFGRHSASDCFIFEKQSLIESITNDCPN